MVLGLTVSCNDHDIVDANYPEPEVYLPLARSGIYVVNDTTKSDNPISRYIIDVENNKLLIPIGIYRSGVNNKGNVTVELGTDGDTIRKLISEGDVFDPKFNDPEILSEENYFLPASVTIKDGNDYAMFNLEIDLPFIQNNLGKRYALAVAITASSNAVSEKYNTAIIDFNTRFVGAIPKFSCRATKEDPKSVVFTNLTTYALSYEWDFGNGQKSTESNPTPQTYPTVGTYQVSLTAKGIDGKQNKYTQNLVIWDVITNNYIKNPGDPFRRAGVITTGRTDVIADWSYTSNVLSTVSGGVDIGGWQGDGSGVMDFYANASTRPDGLQNAKIYQSFELEAGYYQFGFTQYSITGVSNCFAVVSLGTELPDIENINSDARVLGKFNWTETDNLGDDKQGVEFQLDSKQIITVGFVITNEVRGRLKIRSVSLAK
jgi:hypothetical protein